MTKLPATFIAATATLLVAMITPAAAQNTAAPTSWDLKPDIGYGFVSNGKLFMYKMGTSNAALLLKGARKVPKNTLFFLGANGQLYMRSGKFLEKDGSFTFGPG
jgi:hypothetical protein